ARRGGTAGIRGDDLARSDGARRHAGCRRREAPRRNRGGAAHAGCGRAPLEPGSGTDRQHAPGVRRLYQCGNRQVGEGGPGVRRKGGVSMKILVVDDHALIRDALRGVLKELKEDATVVEAVDSRQALRLTDENPDVGLVLLDLNLPERSGFDVLAELRGRHPAVSVVVLSALSDRDSVARALDLGATGFIPKSASREVMLSALRLVFSGGVYIPPEILGSREPSAKRGLSAARASPASPRDLGLTGRQVEIL